jgi:uncharacterized protein (TIGR02117 family)
MVSPCIAHRRHPYFPCPVSPRPTNKSNPTNQLTFTDCVTALRAAKVHCMLPSLLKCLVLVIVLVGSVACTTPGSPLYPVLAQEESKYIYVERHDWHTGLVVKYDDIDSHLWPEKDDFPEALYLEVGWGDRDFYQAARPGLGILLQAALKSPASVLFVIGLPTAVTRYFPHADILEIPLSQRGLNELVSFIHATYKRDTAGQTIRLGLGHNHQHSMFYLAEGDYSLFNTCNSWISRALQAAGLPIKTALLARGVMRQAQRYGRMIQRQAEAEEPQPVFQRPPVSP